MELNNKDIRWELITNFNIGRKIRNYHIDKVMAARGFKFIGEGSMRRTYLSPNKRYVLKFPTNKLGICANAHEHNTWHKHKSHHDNKGIFYAPCRLIKNTVLMMWSCSESFGNSYGCENAFEDGTLTKLSSDDMPDWVCYLDCRQAGILRNGKIAAYDYG